ncbi:MAG TPA: alpha/beta hydrolase [Syntrophales bacterium]|nr:alpha/beta hydrolase [Syntrophales bacterium]
MPFIEVEDGRVYYEASGMGKHLILIHGAWASHVWWRWQVPVLSEHYRVVTIDVRGHGLSSPLKGASSVEQFARDLREIIDKIGADETVLVGWSMGGLIAMQYCLDYPLHSKALILIATRGHRTPRLKQRIRLHYLWTQLNFLSEISAPRGYDRRARQFPDGQNVIKKEITKMLSPSASQETFDWVTDELTKRPVTNYYEVARSIWDWGPEEELKRIDIPALLLVGDGDRSTPPRFSSYLHSLLPNSRLKIIEGVGHCLIIEDPPVVNREIIEFLREVGY